MIRPGTQKIALHKTKTGPKSVNRDELLVVLRQTDSIRSAAESLQMSIALLRKTMADFSISAETIKALRKEKRRQACIDEYMGFQQIIGRFPTTTDLEANLPGPGARSLYGKIIREWRQFTVFREEINVPAPTLGNPEFREHVAPALERRRYLLFMRREEASAKMIELLRSRRVATLRDMVDEVNLSPTTVTKLIKQLVVRGIVRIERHSSRKYYYLEEA